MFSNVALLDLDTPELVLILLIVLLLFGGKKLPELSRALGSSMKELKKGINEAQGAKDDLKKQTTDIADRIEHSGESEEKQS
jgi:sec-independent protein translocase protein TatA